MEDLYNHFKGDNKLSTYITSNIPMFYDLTKGSDGITFKPRNKFPSYYSYAYYHETDETNHLGVLIPDLTIEDSLYRVDYHTVTFDDEPKIDCYPFRYFKLTSMRGNSLIIRPEHLRNEDTTTNIQFNVSYYLSIVAVCKEDTVMDR